MNGTQSSLLVGPKPADIETTKHAQTNATAVGGADAAPGIAAAVGTAIGITLGAAAGNAIVGMVIGGGVGALLGVGVVLSARRSAER